MAFSKDYVKTNSFSHARFKELSLFFFSVSGCVAVWGISHYLISNNLTPAHTIGGIERTVLGTLLFVSFLWGHALGLSIQNCSRERTGLRNYEQYTLSLCLRILAAMLGMILALLSFDLVWSSGASLISIMSLIGTQFRQTKT